MIDESRKRGPKGALRRASFSAGQVILVASNAKAGAGRGSVRAELLKGPTEDPSMDWITMGYPQLAQGSGKFYFEVNLIEGFGISTHSLYI